MYLKFLRKQLFEKPPLISKTDIVVFDLVPYNILIFLPFFLPLSEFALILFALTVLSGFSIDKKTWSIFFQTVLKIVSKFHF